jgi:hypothetical protein
MQQKGSIVAFYVPFAQLNISSDDASICKTNMKVTTWLEA